MGRAGELGLALLPEAQERNPGEAGGRHVGGRSGLLAPATVLPLGVEEPAERAGQVGLGTGLLFLRWRAGAPDEETRTSEESSSAGTCDMGRAPEVGCWLSNADAGRRDLPGPLAARL